MEKNSLTQPCCPNCSKEYTRRVSTAGAQEWLLSVFYVYPFNCQLCGHRFRIFQGGIRYRRVRRDRREFHRLPTSFPVIFAGDGIEGRGKVTDIAMGGCGIQTDADLAPGTSVRVSLYLSIDHDPVNVDVAVIRTARQNRVGVEFLEVRPSDRERLQSFVHALWLGREATHFDRLETFGDRDEETLYVWIDDASENSSNLIRP